MSAYFQTMLPYAQQARAGCGLPTGLILAQWANESAYGTSPLAKNHRNHGGIKYTSRADYQAGVYSGYNSLHAFTVDYVRVMNLWYLAAARAAAAAGKPVPEIAYHLGRGDGTTRYAESQYAYGGTPGLDLVNLYNSQGLAVYDAAQPAPVPEPDPGNAPIVLPPVTVTPTPGGGYDVSGLQGIAGTVIVTAAMAMLLMALPGLLIPGKD